jgi:hypothetical protein
VMIEHVPALASAARHAARAARIVSGNTRHAAAPGAKTACLPTARTTACSNP